MNRISRWYHKHLRHRFTQSPVYTNKVLKGPAFLIGEHTYGWPEIMFANSGSRLVIGKFCSISKEVKIFLGGNHRMDWVSMYPFKDMQSVFTNGAGVTGHPASNGDVVIGNDVWIGYGATILSGITIGDGAVIGANAHVIKDVEPYQVVGGNPAKEIRKRFDEETIAALLKIKWWDWHTKKINEEIALLSQPDISAFVNKHRVD